MNPLQILQEENLNYEIYSVYTGRFEQVRNRFQLLSGLIEVSVTAPKSISKRLKSLPINHLRRWFKTVFKSIAFLCKRNPS